jgi:acetolactate synthase-1/2/3 large subunit
MTAVIRGKQPLLAHLASEVDSLEKHPLNERRGQVPDLADILLLYLEQLGIEYIFGVPGGAIEPLYNALARSERRGGPRAILARHETGAAFMADAYARQTGKIGVCCATTGPGTTNLITGVASAYANHSPLLVITAQTALSSFGRGAFQDSSCVGINTLAMFEQCTRYNTLVCHVDQFEHMLTTALITAVGSPPGPVHLSLPLDILRQPAPISRERYDIRHLLRATNFFDSGALEQLCQLADKPGKIVFVICEGAQEGIGSILSTACLLGARIVTTPHGKGLVSPYHPLYRGVIGFAGHHSAIETLRDSDQVIAIGTAFGEWASNGWDTELLLNERLIHIDEEPENFTRSPMAKLQVHGRISTVFDRLFAYLREQFQQRGEDPKTLIQQHLPKTSEPTRHFEHNSESAFNDGSFPIKPQRLMHDLPTLFPPHTLYLADTGNSFAWAIHYLHPYDRRRQGARQSHGGLFRACLEFASMGWAIGYAIGAALACRNRPVVCITGDGSMLMSGQEIGVAVQEELNVTFIVLNDMSLGMVRHGQKLTGAESIATQLPKTNFAAIAIAQGATGRVIRSPQELHQLDIASLCKVPGPTLLDVHIDADEVPPIGCRTAALKKN